MDELLLKSFELGALGLFSAILLTRGLNAVKDLADSNRQLADAVAKLSDKVNDIENRVTGFEYELKNLDAKSLSGGVARLSDKVNRIDEQFGDLKANLRGLFSRLEKIEQTLEKLTN